MRANIQKILVSLTLFMMLFGSASIATADIGKDLGSVLGGIVDNMFSGNDSTAIVSLTDFKGGLQAPTTEGYDSKLTQVTSAREFVVKVIKYALSFLGLVAVIIVIYGGVRILTSVGESDGVEKGKKAIMYAVVGILVIMSAYAIVNTVLVAPGGAPAAVQSAQTGVATPAAGKNAQATRMYNLIVSVVTAYQNYAQGVLAIETAQQNMAKLWNGGSFTGAGDATNVVSQIESGYNTIAAALAGMANKSGNFSTLPDMVQYQSLFVKKWAEERKAEIDIVAKTPVTVGTVTNSNMDENPINFNGAFLAYNCSADTPITVPSDDECIRGRFSGSEYGKNFAAKFADLLSGLNGGQYDLNGSKIDIGINQMKTQLAADFDANMNQYSKELASIKNSLSGADKTLILTEAGRALFEDLYTNAAGGDLIAQLKQDKISPIESKKTLKQLVTDMGGLFEILKDLQGVDVKLAASIKEGNAPLIVTFNTKGSRDPSNLSIVDDNVSWDLDGDGVFGITGKEVNSLDCTEPKSQIATCIYKKPGTYRIAVRIKSASPDNSVVEGIQYMDIKVNPARARFNIELIKTKTNNDQESVLITAYDKNGLLKIDRSRVQLAFSEIQKSLKFSATGTVSGDITKIDGTGDPQRQTEETIQRVKWTFGDGSSIDDSPADNPNILVVDHPYTKKGNYQVVLEVTGKDGTVDRKIFTISVADISAIINVSPNYTTTINAPLTFTSSVTSDGSRVISTEWSSSPTNDKLTSTDPQFSAAIDKPGTYSVALRVQNESQGEAIDKVDVTIQSNPPVAKFTVTKPKANRPAEVVLDGSASYDPDGEGTKILYSWRIDGEENKDYKILDGTEMSKVLRLQYLTTGDRKVELTVEDQNEKGRTTKAVQAISIKSLLDADWLDSTQSTGVLGATGEAQVTLAVQSSTGKTYSWDFGDGEVEDGIFTTPQAQTTHTYKKAGVYTAFITVKDDSDGSLKLSKRISIGSGDAPIVSSHILVNGIEPDNMQLITITRKDIVTFDASESRNRDGTASNLNYAWDFGDGKISTKTTSTYSYKTLSPKDAGYFTAKIVITDKTDPTKFAQDSFKINVASLKPQMKTLLVVPLTAEMKTPMKVQLKAVEAKAPEGSIVSYRWWYYDPKDDTNELGSQITTVPQTTLTIGTKGQEGDEITYVFQVELRDSENQTITAGEILGVENLPTLTVTNGANKPPAIQITANKAAVNVGDAVTFTATATDPDGKVVSYIWDLDGNGFQDDVASPKSTATKTYTAISPNGIKVSAKAIDDSYAETISDPVSIFVTSKTTPPKAGFTYEQKPGTLQVDFKNTTTIDPSLSPGGVSWDFDTLSNFVSADSDGNGNKADDKDSVEQNSSSTYKAPFAYYVKLSVKDSLGLTDSITRQVIVTPVPVTPQSAAVAPAFSAPTTATTTIPLAPVFKAVLKTTPEKNTLDNRIHLSGTAGNIIIDYSGSQGDIAKYVIDKNIYFDSNNDGIADNDANYTALVPGKWTTDFQKSWGRTGIKLTVYDKNGKSSSDISEIIFDNPIASGASNIFIVPGSYELVGSLASMFGFGILSYRSRKNTKNV